MCGCYGINTINRTEIILGKKKQKEKKKTFANNADADETARNELSQQDTHCLPLGLLIFD